MANVTQDQLQQIQAKVTQLVTDKADADAKTQKSNADDTAAAQATAQAAQSKLDEAAADAKASATLSDLSSFIDAVVTPNQPPPTP